MRLACKAFPYRQNATMVIAADERRCGYSQCGEPLEYDGQGRPPEYCRDRRWPGGRTCKQMAAAERAGERAAGLDAPLDTFRASTDRLARPPGPPAPHPKARPPPLSRGRHGLRAPGCGGAAAMSAAAKRARDAEAAGRGTARGSPPAPGV